MRNIFVLYALLALPVNIASADVYRMQCGYTVPKTDVSGNYDVFVDDKQGIAMFVQKDVRANAPSAVSNSRIQMMQVVSIKPSWPMRLITLRDPRNGMQFVASFVDHDFNWTNVNDSNRPPQQTNSSRVATDKCE